MPQVGLHHASVILVCDLTYGAACSVIHHIEDGVWCDVHVACHVRILSSEGYQEVMPVQKLCLHEPHMPWLPSMHVCVCLQLNR